MKTLTFAAFSLASIASLAACLTACASASSTDPSVGSVAAAAQADPASLDGTWVFAIDASDVAEPVRARCATKAAGDAAKADACWREIATQAAREKIRFGKDGAGRAVWTSFGMEGDKEEIFVEVPVELGADGPGHVLAKIAGKATGGMAAQLEKANITVMRIELVDARTIAMNDPKKGRLVYTKER
ncbi:MAG: hypothetical protein KF819_27810 [Labilithrix sp.]|nr:hypothetical protein [Labilithrix sp.]